MTAPPDERGMLIVPVRGTLDLNAAPSSYTLTSADARQDDYEIVGILMNFSSTSRRDITITLEDSVSSKSYTLDVIPENDASTLIWTPSDMSEGFRIPLLIKLKMAFTQTALACTLTYVIILRVA